MGRPIKKKFFGNLINPYQNHATGGKTGVGGEGVASVAVSNSGTVYSQGTTLAFAAPNIEGGIQAVPAYSINSAGNITVSVETTGSGYTSAPVLTVTTASVVTKVSTGTTATRVVYPATTTGIFVGMKVTGTGISASTTFVTSIVGSVVNLTWPNAANVATTLTFSDQGASFAKTVALTTTRPDAISFTSYLTTGTTAVSGGDILKQESSRRYLVQNSEGKGQCKLIATNTLTTGTMYIVATDAQGCTYWVTKLTAHKARLKQRTSAGTGYLIVDGAVAGWNIGTPTGTIVTIANTN
jgi:hypothetical protein